MRSRAEDPGEGSSTATQTSSTSTKDVSDPRSTTYVEATIVPTQDQATSTQNRDMQARTVDLENRGQGPTAYQGASTREGSAFEAIATIGIAGCDTIRVELPTNHPRVIRDSCRL